jgi:hypothetical protein
VVARGPLFDSGPGTPKSTRSRLRLAQTVKNQNFGLSKGALYSLRIANFWWLRSKDHIWGAVLRPNNLNPEICSKVNESVL